MGLLVSAGAVMQCSFGVAPSTLMVLPINRVLSPMPIANIMDHVPFLNILPFGLCRSVANPVVAAAMAVPPPGVLKPMPCTPMTAAPWVPGVPTVLVGSMPAVDMNCKLMCSFGGVIQIISPGQFTALT
jgi:hypothetical protein